MIFLATFASECHAWHIGLAMEATFGVLLVDGPKSGPDPIART